MVEELYKKSCHTEQSENSNKSTFQPKRANNLSHDANCIQYHRLIPINTSKLIADFYQMLFDKLPNTYFQWTEDRQGFKSNT